ncbi:MAG: hypothetical protein EOM11_07625 [Erysipelotrichia bacterium]|nr:hypothetical protein [Erysipelotrichia bacterium]
MAEKKSIDSILTKSKSSAVSTFEESKRKKADDLENQKVNMLKKIVLLLILVQVNWHLWNRLQMAMA